MAQEIVESFRGLADWFRGWFYAPDGDFSFLGNACVAALAVLGLGLLFRWTLREAERAYAKDEGLLPSLFRPPAWRLGKGGRRVEEMEFYPNCLEGTAAFFSPLRPLLEREEAESKVWLFQQRLRVSGSSGTVRLAVCVIRRPDGRWPRLLLLNRAEEVPGEALTGQNTPRRFRERWPELCKRWNIWARGNELEAERFLESAEQLLLRDPATTLRRIEVGGEYLACVGNTADPAKSFPDVLKRAERLAEQLDQLRGGRDGVPLRRRDRPAGGEAAL